MLEGHELFLSGLTNNNKVCNFLSLMPRNESCQCFRRLVFCGYATADSSSVGDQYLRSFNDTEDERKNVTVLLPTGVISTLNNTSSAWHDLRMDLINGISERYDDLNGRVCQYQRQVLIDMGLIRSNDKDAGNNFEDEWTFVGLARRKYRRSWLNLNDTLSMCNERFQQHHIVCITVDVEDAGNAEEQLIMRRSLHAFIGIHGAQLTQEGIFLQSHSLILELLPHISPGDWGGWVAMTEAPTPLGVIFHNTDLNHFGYPLGKESCSPLCIGLDVRDFNVSVEVTADFLSGFVLKVGKNNTMTCDEMKNEAERTNFVLYNAFCRRRANESEFINEHYYRAFPQDEEG